MADNSEALKKILNQSLSILNAQEKLERRARGHTALELLAEGICNAITQNGSVPAPLASTFKNSLNLSPDRAKKLETKLKISPITLDALVALVHESKILVQRKPRERTGEPSKI